MAGFLSDNEFKLFKDLIYTHSGICFSTTNRPILESRLKERLKEAQVANVLEYHQLILVSDEEMKTLLDSVTTNLTRFFRNQGHFEAFEKHMIPRMVDYKKKNNQNHIKLWSAGCSTGEEPYSLAMVMKEKLPPGCTFNIIGSDISLKSLMTAKEGFYTENRIGGVTPYYLQKYFDRKIDGYRIHDEIQKLVTFDYHNLKFESGLQDIDLLFCRNVLIYFDAEAQKSTVDRFFRVMNPHSFLVIGHSESLFGMNTQFEFVKTDWATFYAKFHDRAENRE